jgi:hypothetical protein
MTYQPYGQAVMQAPMLPPRQSYKAFGITYMCVRGLMLVLFLILMAFAGAYLASLTSGGGSGGRGGTMPSDVTAGFAIVIAVLLAWLAYVIAAGIMAIKGMIAGVYMGLVDAGLTLLLGLFGLATGEVAGAMCWLVPSGAIITLGIFALKQRYGRPAQPYGAPAYGAPRQYGAPVQRYGAPSPQYGAAPQQGYASAPQQGYAPAQQPRYAPPGAPQPSGEATSAVVPSPKMAALGILALAASVDPDISQEALGRARAVAAKLLGPAAQARIQRQLAAPMQVMDVDTDLVQHTMILNQQSNDAMKANVIKAAEYVLKGPNGVEGLGEQFMATLKQQLGV